MNDKRHGPALDSAAGDPARRVGSAKVRSLYTYWCAKRGSRRMPSRADIDPGDIAPLLPYVLLADLHRDPLRVYYRLVGTALVEAFGRESTGRWLDEPEQSLNPERWQRTYERLVHERQPIFGRARANLRAGDERFFEWVILPLSGDGERVDKTLELEDWEGLRSMSPEQIERATWTVEVFD